MTLLKAKRIEELRTGSIVHSWRRISEIVCEEFKDEDQELKGVQIHGQDLCKEAMMLIHGYSSIQDVPDGIREVWDT